MKIKVCGMKYPENILKIAALQPDYVGFIFYDKSPRNFEGIIPELPKSTKKVGVFVNEYLEILVSLVEEYKLDVIQFHGDESVDYIKQLKTHLPKVEIIKVFGIKDEFDFSVLEDYIDVVDYFLFDTKGENRGGNGVTFNWEVLKDYPYTKPYFLSGGIGLNEVEDLMSFLQKQESQCCYAVDVNSKFEIEPGLKSVEKIQKFKKSVITNEVK
ncbi:phosphoribosylanthranilate isomerase [Tenacibaculum sp. IB213877]|uniref:phosphoribosylanthranilate isomerase n=1 Tax=Tenacibaculum sp. IB213877 TaxID=3097351 RepID=UPI002A5A68A9|nr:phosphoribosylanthranilate isomerase [Tenacibaculum sp. IB213877]MDY0780169.1 phosphoribosylanthranilate isomerase [Tenacibaculum sp. IB213877]